MPTLLLEHRGRKSGQAVRVPLVYMQHGDDVIVVGVPWAGGAENPQWYLNLVADPEPMCRSERERRAVHAVTRLPEQRAALWPKLVEVYADFDTYQNWTEREIPVVILQPR